MQLDPDQLRFSIERFRDQNIDDRAYQKELINTFVKAIYVYDDRLKIVLNRGPGDDIEVPFKEIADFEGTEDPASRFVQTTLSRTKEVLYELKAKFCSFVVMADRLTL